MQLSQVIEIIDDKMSDNGFIDTSSRGSRLIDRLVGQLGISERAEATDYIRRKYVYHEILTSQTVFTGYTTKLGYYDWLDYIVRMGWVKEDW